MWGWYLGICSICTKFEADLCVFPAKFAKTRKLNQTFAYNDTVLFATVNGNTSFSNIEFFLLLPESNWADGSLGCKGQYLEVSMTPFLMWLTSELRPEAFQFCKHKARPRTLRVTGLVCGSGTVQSHQETERQTRYSQSRVKKAFGERLKRIYQSFIILSEVK